MNESDVGTVQHSQGGRPVIQFRWPLGTPALGIRRWALAVTACVSLAACSSVPATGGLTITKPATGTTVTTTPVLVEGTAPAGSRIVRDIPLALDDETAADTAGRWSMQVDLDTGENVLTFRIGDDQDTAESISVTLASTAATVTAPPISSTRTPTPATAPPAGSYDQLTKRQWSQLVKAPDDHLGDAVIAWACITQFDAATGTDAFRGDAYFENNNSDYWLDAENAVFSGSASQLADFVADDIVRVKAVVLGSITYDTSIGGSTTVPAFRVDVIEHKGDCD